MKVAFWPREDSNPESLASEADSLSIEPRRLISKQKFNLENTKIYENYRVQFLLTKIHVLVRVRTVQASKILIFKLNIKGFYFIGHQFQLYSAIKITKNCLFFYIKSFH